MRTRLGVGLGPLGRDMVAALVSMYLLFYLTDVLEISGPELAVITAILVLIAGTLADVLYAALDPRVRV